MMKHHRWLGAILLLLPGAAWAAGGNVTMGLLLEQAGKFHPMVIHFPIVFIFLLPVVLIISRCPWGKTLLPAVPFLVHLGALTALAATVLGLSAAAGLSLVPAKLAWHRNLAILATVLTCCASGYLLWKKPSFEKEVPKILLILSLAAAGVLTLGAHFGAETTHGPTIILFNNAEADVE